MIAGTAIIRTASSTKHLSYILFIICWANPSCFLLPDSVIISIISPLARKRKQGCEVDFILNCYRERKALTMRMMSRMMMTRKRSKNVVVRVEWAFSLADAIAIWFCFAFRITIVFFYFFVKWVFSGDDTKLIGREVMNYGFCLGVGSCSINTVTT